MLGPIAEDISRILENAGISTTTPTDYSLEHQIEMHNSRPGKLEGYDCPICLNRGHIFYADGDVERVRDCECMTIRRNRRRVERSGLSDALERYNFESWQTPESWQAKVLDKAKEYAEHPDGWLIAVGHSGSGKTHICTAVCGKLMDSGIDTLYIRWRDFSTKAKGLVNDASGYGKLLESVKTVECLYIDDFFKSGNRPTPADINLAYEILNVRYDDRRKLTIISTEMTVEELADTDEAMASRIYERSQGHVLNFVGKENWRWR